MRNLNQILTVGAFLGGVFISQPTMAQKMNSNTQDLVITKMERVLSAMDKTDSAWLASQQRLADLLSERARTRFMSEVESNCDGCKGSKDDRQKAIKIYESLLAEVKINEHAPILFQLAHLYEMAGQQDKAIALYERILKNAKAQKTSAAIVSRSQASLGDLLFQKGKFNEAREQYIIALKDKNLENRALTIYNKAWCEFNTDRLAMAVNTLEELLSNPKQISRTTDKGSQYDAVFHADIMRDLATFYSRRDITTRDIAKFDNLLPATERKELTLHFADEADRVGQKQAAHRILNKYMENPDLTKEERLAAFVKMAQVNYDRGQASQSTADFAKAAEAFKSGCSDEKKCQDLEKMMKRYVTELHRSKKVKPDQDLLNAYMTYQKTFPADVEMTKRAAQVAVDIGNTTTAVLLYRTISETRGFSEKERNEALLNEITLAEKSGNPTVQRDAYLHFLKYSSDDKRKFAVRYQLAYLSYQQKQLVDAAKAFNTLAQDKDGAMELRLKSAHLSLDALAQLNDDESIEKWSTAYAQIFPQSRNEFAGLSRKALMNRVAKVANDKGSSQSDLKKALRQVVNTKDAGSTPQERILFYTNQSVLAQKAGEDEIYISSLQALAAIPQLSQDRRNETLSQLAAFHEKKLDFKNAYLVSVRAKKAKENAADREFRLGTLADLANMNPEQHYKASLKAGLRGERVYVVRSRLVYLSRNPVAELKSQASVLKQKPALLSELTIYVFAKTRDKQGLKSVLALKELKRQPAPLFIAKQDFYGKIASFDRQISALELNSKTDRLMAKSIEARVQKLKQADKLLSEALALKDVTSQMLVLNLVTLENERMVKDLAGLPVPKGLSPAEQKQYIGILKTKSKPFLVKARVSQQKQQEIWNTSPALAQLIKDYKTTRPEVQKLLERELKMLVQLPTSGKYKSMAESALRQSSFSSHDLASARRSVSDNPESVNDLENLKFLETKIGNPMMASYLDSRLSQLQKGRSL